MNEAAVMNEAATAMSRALQLLEDRLSSKGDPDTDGSDRRGGGRPEAGATSASICGSRREADATSAARDCVVGSRDADVAACVAAASVFIGRQHLEAMPLFLRVMHGIHGIKDLPTPAAHTKTAYEIENVIHQVCFRDRADVRGSRHLLPIAEVILYL